VNGCSEYLLIMVMLFLALFLELIRTSNGKPSNMEATKKVDVFL